MSVRPRDDPAQPHDRLVKFAFSQRRHAVGLLKAILDAALVADAAWDTLRLLPHSFVSRALRSRHLDLLFSVKIRGEDVYVYVLVEQQRKVEALMIVRMNTYMGRAWERLVADEPSRKLIPPIVPVLIHHSETGWTAPTSFHEVVAMPDALRPALARSTPGFEMEVVDLSPGRASHIVDEMLTAFGKMVLWCLSVAGDDERLQKEIGRMAEALDEMLAAGDAVDALHAILRYLLATHRRLGAPRIARMLETTASKGQQKVIMDELDAFRVEGREEGRKEGRIEGAPRRGARADAAGAAPGAVRGRPRRREGAGPRRERGDARALVATRAHRAEPRRGVGRQGEEGRARAAAGDPPAPAGGRLEGVRGQGLSSFVLARDLDMGHCFDASPNDPRRTAMAHHWIPSELGHQAAD